MTLVHTTRADQGDEGQEASRHRDASRRIADERPREPAEEAVDPDERDDVATGEAGPAERRGDHPEVTTRHGSRTIHDRLQPGRDEGSAPGRRLERRLGPEPDEPEAADDRRRDQSALRRKARPRDGG